jgi:hypothetical protein
LLAMNHLNDGTSNPFAFMTFTSALHIKTWNSTSYDCMSHIKIIMTTT